VDTHFLEFWGSLLLSAARGQRQLEEFSHWMSQGMSGFRELTDMFQQVYGLGTRRPDGEAQWETARRSFETAYRAYLEMLGGVPKAEYTALEKQVEALQEKVQHQEADLRRLRLELSECRMAEGNVVRGFQELIQVQSAQFQELTESVSRFFAARRTENQDPA
jgi:hypothetical protein